MRRTSVDIHLEHCGGRERTFEARVISVVRKGDDKVGEARVSLMFELALRHGRQATLIKIYHGPFTHNSSLIRDLRRIVGPQIAKLSVIDLNLVLNRRCTVKVLPGEVIPQIQVLRRIEGDAK